MKILLLLLISFYAKVQQVSANTYKCIEVPRQGQPRLSSLKLPGYNLNARTLSVNEDKCDVTAAPETTCKIGSSNLRLNYSTEYDFLETKSGEEIQVSCIYSDEAFKKRIESLQGKNFETFKGCDIHVEVDTEVQPMLAVITAVNGRKKCSDEGKTYTLKCNLHEKTCSVKGVELRPLPDGNFIVNNLKYFSRSPIFN